MELVRYIQQKAKPFPLIYDFLIFVYSICAEVRFFFHALITGKLFHRLSNRKFKKLLPRQEVLLYQIRGLPIQTVDDLRDWFKKKNVVFNEGGWTFYLPPQDGLSRIFGNILDNYPENSGLKILKDLRAPDQARYTRHRQNPAPGAALKRLLTPSPSDLVRVANYLYSHGLGIRVYDLIALQCDHRLLTSYVVQHLDGNKVGQKDYDLFIDRLKSTLNKGEVSTIHEKTDIMWDFEPIDCNGNLINDDKIGRPLYVDFQTFFLRNEVKILERSFSEIQGKIYFDKERLPKGVKKHPCQSVPCLLNGIKNIGNSQLDFQEMLEEVGCSFNGKVIYDVGCKSGLMLNNALSCGALWGIGWDLPNVIKSAEKLLLSLGATRFDLIGERINDNTDFLKHVPDRFKLKKDGILFFRAANDHMGFPSSLSALPWEYMFYEGKSNQDYEIAMKMISQISWLKGVEVISHRIFADGEIPKRMVLLLRRRF